MHEVLARFEHHAAIIAGEQPHFDPLGDAFDVAVGVGGDGFIGGRGIEAKDEDLFFVHRHAFVRQHFHDRGSAGGQLERLPAFEPVAGQRQEAGLQTETATHAGKQVAAEVVHPVLLIRPARSAGLGTFDVERLRQARIAKCNHRFGKPCLHLAHALDLSPRREHFHLRRRDRAGNQQQQNRGPVCLHSLLAIRSTSMN